VEDGFLETIAKYKGIQVIEKNRYVSGTTEGAKNECMKMADKLKEADGIFCSYEINNGNAACFKEILTWPVKSNSLDLIRQLLHLKR